MTTMTETTVSTFEIHFPDETLAHLRRRIAATNWPERELVPDDSQGVQLDTMRKLAAHWETNHDWRTIEARLGDQLIQEGAHVHSNPPTRDCPQRVV